MIMSKALTSSIIIPCFSECEYCQTTPALEYHGFKVDSFNDQLFLQFYNTLKSENVLWNQGMSFFVDWSTISAQAHSFFY
jgi:hypothetical protein